MGQRKEKDFVRSALRALNLQALVGVLVVFILPYFFIIHTVDFFFQSMWNIAEGYAEILRGEFAAAPTPEHAMFLAREHGSLIALEGKEGTWYTDGGSVVTLEKGTRVPYYDGWWSRFALDDGSHLVITWPTAFLNPTTHAQVFITWIVSPMLFFLLLYFLMRRTLRPLRWMQRGLQELTAGNLDYEAPVKGRDSRNILALKFNTMTASLRELIRSKDRLLMDVSHELRSPVTRMKVALEMLPEDKHTAVLRKNLQNLEEIVITILESQRINLQAIDLHMEPVRLAVLLRECLEASRHLQPGIRFGDLDESLVVRADKSLLKLLVHNLLDNAQKYSLDDSKPVILNLRREGDHALIGVIDDGIGIAEENLLKVFEPFYKIAPERGFNSGYGLGLSLCKRIAEIHGGRITLRGRKPRGLEVTVELELAG